MGRSGTTIIFEAFANHEKLGYLSNYTNKFFRFPQIGLIHRFFGKQGQKLQGQKVFFLNKTYPRTNEAYPTWEYLCGKKFRYSFLKNIGPTDGEIKKTRDYFKKILIYQGKKRFTTKLTGPPRMKFLAYIFPDAIFVDIIRDPRAVVASLLNVEFWKLKGLYNHHWRDSLNKEHIKIWEESGRSPVTLAALEWHSAYEQTLIERQDVNPKYLQIKYEEFVENPKRTMDKIYKFVGLKLSNRVNNYMNMIKYKNMNYKYHEILTKKDVQIIENICQKQINKLYYIYSYS